MRSWLIALLVFTAALMVGATAWVVTLNSQLNKSRDDLESAREAFREEQTDIREEQEDADDEIQNLESKLEKALATIRAGKRADRQLAEEVAFSTEGLSADTGEWDCQWRGYKCVGVKGHLLFINDTDVPGPITCVFNANLENGDVNRFEWATQYVPAHGETVEPVYWFVGADIATLGWEECFRG